MLFEVVNVWNGVWTRVVPYGTVTPAAACLGGVGKGSDTLGNLKALLFQIYLTILTEILQ